MESVTQKEPEVKFLSWGKKAEVMEGVREAAERSARVRDIREFSPRQGLITQDVLRSVTADGIEFLGLPLHERLELLALYVETYSRVQRERAAGGAA